MTRTPAASARRRHVPSPDARRVPPARRRRSSAQRWATPVAWLLGAALLPVASVTATAAPATAQTPAINNCSQVPPTDANGKPVTKPYDPNADPLLLPPWGDGGGWTNASSYSTIVSGDIDDDGWGDLIGRNGNVLDAYTPAPPSRQWDAPPFSDASVQGKSVVRPPFPQQWVPKAAVTPPTTPDPFTPTSGVPTFNEGVTNAVFVNDPKTPAAVPGFGDQSRYSTFRLADLDGPAVPGKQLIVRAPVFGPPPPDGTAHPYGNSAWPYVNTYVGTSILVFGYRNGQWVALTSGAGQPQWPDAPAGAFGAQSTTIAGDPFFLPQYYQSISVGDVNGDGRDELVGRLSQGVASWSWNEVNGFGVADGNTTPVFPDSAGMDTGPEYWSTLRVAHFIPDGTTRAEVLARTPTGVQLWRLERPQPAPAPPTWVLKSTITDAAFAKGSDPGTAYAANEKSNGDLTFNQAVPVEAASTIRAADLDGDGASDVMVLDTSGKLHAYSFDANGNPTSMLPTPQLLAPGATPGVATKPQYWATLQGGDVVGSAAQEVLIRASDGLHVYQYDANGQWLDEVTTLQLPQMSDANGWDDVSKYSTIRTVTWATPSNPLVGSAKGAPRTVLVGRDATGMRTYWINPTSTTPSWTAPSAGFPAWAGGTDPTSHGDGTVWGQTYKYLNDQVAAIMNWGPVTYPGNTTTPAYPTIRSKFGSAPGVTNWSDIATLVSLQPPPSDAINVTRADFESVKLQLADWSRDYDALLRFFFSSSTGVQQLYTQALIVGDQGFPISEIEAQFSPPDHSRMWALIGDLIWGLMAAISPELVAGYLSEDAAAKLLSQRGKNAFQFVMNFGGAAVAAGLTYADSSKGKQAQLDIEAAQLNATLAASFCAAISFLYGSAQQAGGDLGLLLAMGQTVRSTSFDLAQYDAAVASLSRQRTVWAYQQFASMNPDGSKGTGWQEGWCQGNAWCPINPTKQPPPTTPGQFTSGYSGYWPVGKDCSDTKRPEDPLKTLTQSLNVDPGDLAGLTYAWWDSAHPPYKNTYVGMPVGGKLEPVPDGMSGTPQGTGTNGWRLPLIVCLGS